MQITFSDKDAFNLNGELDGIAMHFYPFQSAADDDGVLYLTNLSKTYERRLFTGDLH